MHKKWSGFALGLALIFAAGPSKAISLFEGEVDYDCKGGNNGSAVSEFIKGNKIRMGSKKDAQETSMVMDFSARKAWIVMPQQKTYMEIPVPGAGVNPWAGPATFVKADKMEDILGYPCEKWSCKTDQGQTSVWLTMGMGAFEGLGSLVYTGDTGWVKNMEMQGLFPLKITQSDKDGKLKGSMTAVKITKGAPSEDLFEIPSGYKKVEFKVTDLKGIPTPKATK